LHERLVTLIDSCQAAIALPGGPGTLTEIALTWNLLLTESIAPRPLILIGAGWQATWQAYYQALGDYVPDYQRAWLSFAPNARTAVHLLAVG
jgi:predicted Rossmann-fold nucleotide-binding protein